MNRVERFFRNLSEDRLKRGVFKSVALHGIRLKIADRDQPGQGLVSTGTGLAGLRWLQNSEKRSNPRRHVTHLDLPIRRVETAKHRADPPAVNATSVVQAVKPGGLHA